MARLYLRQLLAGREFACSNPTAHGMQNFVYLVGDRDAGECVVIDPAWDIEDLIQIADADGLKIVGALATHYHPDHVGGSIFGMTIEGVAKLMTLNPCKVHTHRYEADGLRQVTGLSKSDLVEHDSGDRLTVGEIDIEMLHTPGHTPGSQCFRVKDALLAGDTLFLQGCGRVDLPGASPDDMYYTLTQRLSTLPDDTVLFPGHAYGGEHAPLGQVRWENPYLHFQNIEAWRRAMGYGGR